MSEQNITSSRILRRLDNNFTEFESIHKFWLMGLSYEDFTAANKAQLHMRLKIHNAPATVLDAFETYEFIKSEIRREFGR